MRNILDLTVVLNEFYKSYFYFVCFSCGTIKMALSMKHLSSLKNISFIRQNQTVKYTKMYRDIYRMHVHLTNLINNDE